MSDSADAPPAPDGALFVRFVRADDGARRFRVDPAAAASVDGVVGIVDVFGQGVVDEVVELPSGDAPDPWAGRPVPPGAPIVAVVAETPEAAGQGAAAVELIGVVSESVEGTVDDEPTLVEFDTGAVDAVDGRDVAVEVTLDAEWPVSLGAAVSVVDAQWLGAMLVLRCGLDDDERARQRVATHYDVDPALVWVRPHPGFESEGRRNLSIEELLLPHLSRTFRRVVRWERAGDDAWWTYPSRYRVEIAGRADGTIDALRVELEVGVGSSLGDSTIEPSSLDRLAAGPYRIEQVGVAVRAFASAAPPIGADLDVIRHLDLAREHALDRFARACGVDPIDVRTRNLRPVAAPDGTTFRDLLTAGYQRLDVERVRRQQDERLSTEPLLGIGVSCYAFDLEDRVEASAGAAERSVGAHLCLVSIDPTTAETVMLRHVAVDPGSVADRHLRRRAAEVTFDLVSGRTASAVSWSGEEPGSSPIELVDGLAIVPFRGVGTAERVRASVPGVHAAIADALGVVSPSPVPMPATPEVVRRAIARTDHEEPGRLLRTVRSPRFVRGVGSTVLGAALLALTAATPVASAVLLAGLAVIGYLTAGRTLTVPVVFATSLSVIPARYAFGPYAVTVATVAGFLGLILWAAGRTVDLRRPPRRLSAVISALTALMVVAIATFSVAQLRGVRGIEAQNADRRLFFFIAGAGLVLYLYDVATRLRAVRIVAGAVLGGAAAMAAIGIVQFTTNFDPVQLIALPGLDPGPPFRVSSTGLRRVASTADHPIEFGLVCAMTLPLGMHFARYATSRLARRASFASTGLLMAGALLSVSRSAFLAVVAVLVILVPGWTSTRRFAAVVSLSIGISLFAVAVPDLPGAITELFTDTSDDPSIQGRTTATEDALELIGQEPIFGRGFGTWEPSVTFVVDNQYLVTLLESGVVGLLGLVVLLLTTYLVCRRVARASAQLAPATADLARSLGASVAAASVGAFGLNILRFQATAGLVFVIVALVAALDRIHRIDGPDPQWTRDPVTAEGRVVVAAGPGT